MHLVYCLLLTFIFIALLTFSFELNQQTYKRSQHMLKSRKSSRNKLIIYDPQTGRQIEPLDYLPIKVGMKRKPSQATGNLIELPTLWNPCTCGDLMCICCLGLKLSENFDQKVCTSIAFTANNMSLQLRISHNQRTIVSLGFSALNPPTFCIPILLPFSLNSCLRTTEIRTYDGHIQICLSFILKFLLNQLFELQLDCVRFGINGVKFVKPTPIGVEQASYDVSVVGDGTDDGETEADVDVEEDAELIENSETGVEAQHSVWNAYEMNSRDGQLQENYSEIWEKQPSAEEVPIFQKGRIRSRMA